MDRQRALWGRMFDVVDEYLKEEAAAMNTPPIVSPQEWDAAREELLVKEKELTRARDALAAERRRMPRMAVEKDYAFEGPDGPATPARPVRGAPPADRLPLLLRARRATAGPRAAAAAARSWPTRSPTSPTSTPATPRSRYVSRAPQADIERWKARMGWDIPWYTLTDDFDADFGVDEWHGTNAFYPRRRRPDLPHLLRRQPRRRGAGQHLDLPRHHRARPPGGVGGLARGLPADPAYQWWNLHDEYDAATDFDAAHRERPPRSAGDGARDRDRARRRRAGGGARCRRCRRRRRAAARARLAGAAPAAPAGARQMTDDRTAAHRAHLPRRPPRRCSTRGPARR